MADARTDPYEYPTDEQIARWADEYGSTGVKLFELGGPNAGCVAAYREASLSERAVLARLEGLEKEHPGSIDFPVAFAGLVLLRPALSDFPHPAYAAAELFDRARGHGYAWMDGEGGEGLPSHVALDLANARRVQAEASQAWTAELAMQLATLSGHVDPLALDALWRMPPGRLRDLAARVDLAHGAVTRAAVGAARPADRPKVAEQLMSRFPPVFDDIDRATNGASAPADEEEVESADEVEAPRPVPAGNLPPNSPPPLDDLRRAFE